MRGHQGSELHPHVNIIWKEKQHAVHLEMNGLVWVRIVDDQSEAPIACETQTWDNRFKENQDKSPCMHTLRMDWSITVTTHRL